MTQYRNMKIVNLKKLGKYYSALLLYNLCIFSAYQLKDYRTSILEIQIYNFSQSFQEDLTPWTTYLLADWNAVDKFPF